MKKKVTGRVWKYGDNINTDIIYPGIYLEITDPKQMAKYAMMGYGDAFVKGVLKDDIVVAGKNFGCGSSREHAPLALKEAGVSVVIASFFSRLFYRNSLNIGLPLFARPQIWDFVHHGDLLSVDMEKGDIWNETTGQVLSCPPLSEFELRVLEQGGMIEKFKIEKINKNLGE